MKYLIRKALEKDCFDISLITSIMWNKTYKGIVPSEFLEHLNNTVEERKDKLIESLDNLYVLEVEEKVVGFMKLKFEDTYGEVKALYILSEYHGLGMGRALVEHALKLFKDYNYNKMIIGCLKGNKSNDFYKRIGGKLRGEGVFKVMEYELKENIYEYKID